MAIIRWIIALPFIVGAILFALAHPEKVSTTFSPLQDSIELPLYFVVLLFLAIGFLLGALFAWIGMGQVRKDRRTYKKNVKELTKENEKLNKKNFETLDQHKISTATELIEGN